MCNFPGFARSIEVPAIPFLFVACLYCACSTAIDEISFSDLYRRPHRAEFDHDRARRVGLVSVAQTAVDVPGVTIGEGTAVGALCLVAKDLEVFWIYAGSPLKRIKARSQRLLELEKPYLASSGDRSP